MMNQNTSPKLQSTIYLVLPILPGQAEAWRRFVQELQGPRREAWDRWCQRVGVSRLRVWVQSNQRDMTVLLQGKIRKTMNPLGDEIIPFDRWLREQLLTLHGIDIAQFGAAVKQELVLDIEVTNP